MKKRREFKLKTNVGRQLELLGNRLYKEPFLSGLKEAIKNSDEQGAKVIEIVIDEYKTTTFIEKGGTGIDPRTFDNTIGTIFTESKDKKHFGIGRLGLVLSHSYTDYLSNFNGVIHQWRIFADGTVIECLQEPANNADYSVKIIAYERKKNGFTTKEIRDYLEMYLGLRLYQGLSVTLNGRGLISPLSSNSKTLKDVKFKHDNKIYKFSVYWEESQKHNFSIVSENGIGVRKKTVTGITVYFDQEGYLETKLDREDFQRDAKLLAFLPVMKDILKDIVPRPKTSEEVIDEIWKRIFPMIRGDFYNTIKTDKHRRSRKKEQLPPKMNPPSNIITRKDNVDEGYNAPFLWYDAERERFEWNLSHPVTLDIGKRHKSRKGRMDILALPLERCYFLLRATRFETTDWEYLRKVLVNTDRQLGRLLKKRQHQSTEESI